MVHVHGDGAVHLMPVPVAPNDRGRRAGHQSSNGHGVVATGIQRKLEQEAVVGRLLTLPIGAADSYHIVHRRYSA